MWLSTVSGAHCLQSFSADRYFDRRSVRMCSLARIRRSTHMRAHRGARLEQRCTATSSLLSKMSGDGAVR
jgi:hypothetical protein